MAHIAYIDDSGDSNSMVLGCVIVPVDKWGTVFNELVTFRSRLSKELSFPMGNEMKTTHLFTPSGGGRWRKLRTPMRKRIGVYKSALRLLGDMAPVVQTIAVVAPDRHHPKIQENAIQDCWQVLLERLERFSFKREPQTEVILVPDEGNPLTVRKLARRRRRFAYAPSAFPGGSSQKVPFPRLVEDPLHRNSRDSYFLQWADFVANAAFRTVIPRADLPPNLWGELGDAALAAANGQRPRNEPPGVIVWPDRRM